MPMENRLRALVAAVGWATAHVCLAQTATPGTAASAASPPPIVASEPAVAASAAVPPPSDDPVAQAIYARLQQMAPLDGGPIARQDAALGKAIADFYAQRHDVAAWSDETNVRQLLAGLASVENDGLLPEDYHLSELRAAADALQRP